MNKAPLLERIDAAIQRITSGCGNMRIPADITDPDLVLADCKRVLLERNSLRIVSVAEIRHYQYAGIARNGRFQEAVMRDGAPDLPDGTRLYVLQDGPATPAAPEDIRL